MPVQRESSIKLDRLGLLVFGVLAVILAIMLMNRLNTNDPTVSSTTALTFTAAAAEPEPQPIATTAPVTVPVSTAPAPAIPAPAEALLTSSLEPVTKEAAPEEPAETEEAAAPEEPAETEEAAASEPAAAEPAPTAEAAASASGQSTDAAPAATATAVPNPQTAATAVPNPQPAATAVPNPQPSTSTTAAAAPVGAVPADAPAGGTFTHTLAATVARPTLHTTPGGPVFTPTFNGTALPAVNPTVFGNPLVYRVLAGEPGDTWAKVYVPARPNGTTAWVQTSQFNWGSSNRMLQINASNNTVTVFEGANVLLTTSAVLGKSTSPTPIANGWVEEVMAGPSAAYGTKLISLGMFSDALNSFGGGVPKIALHGTNAPHLMGQYASNGCIRVRNEIINQIAAMLPVGSKVTIVR